MTGRRKAIAPRSPWHYIAVGLSAGAFLLVLLIGVLAVGIPAVTGAKPMTVLTGSMQPSLPPGTLVIIKPTPIDEITVGSVITYQLESGKPTVVTHRVVAVTMTDHGESFTTKGDNNPTADPNPVIPAQVRGTLWYGIPYLGWVNTLVNGENRAWIIPVIAGGLFVYAGYMVVSSIVSSARRKRLESGDRVGEPAN